MNKLESVGRIMDNEIMELTVGGEPKKVKIVKPSSRIEAEANMHASKVFSKLAKEHSKGNSGLLLRTQLDQFLRDSKLYSEEDLVEINSLGKQIEDGEKSLRAGGKKADGRQIAIDMRKARYTMLVMLAKKFEYDRNTIEHHSETARLHYIIAKCLQFEDGGQVYSGPDDYEFDDSPLKDDLAPAIRKITSLCSSFDMSYEEKLPENKFLKKFNFVDDKFNLVDSEGHLVDELGRRIDEQGNLIEDNTETFELGEFTDE